MLIQVQRIVDDGTSSVGALAVDGEFLCYTLEDTRRKEKVAGKTRIPKGTFEVKMRKDLTPLTKKYRKKYDWFSYHLELQDVPDFQFVYIHIGNYHTNTDGCLLVGEYPSAYGETMAVVNSTKVFEVLYKKVSEALLHGEQVKITITDEESLWSVF